MNKPLSLQDASSKPKRKPYYPERRIQLTAPLAARLRDYARSRAVSEHDVARVVLAEFLASKGFGETILEPQNA